jgi:hypothetical protein
MRAQGNAHVQPHVGSLLAAPTAPSASTTTAPGSAAGPLLLRANIAALDAKLAGTVDADKNADEGGIPGRINDDPRLESG